MTELEIVKEKVFKKKWFGLRETYREEYAIIVDGECVGLEETEEKARDRGQFIVEETKKQKEDARIVDKLLKEKGITFEGSYTLLWWDVKPDHIECQIDGWVKIKR